MERNCDDKKRVYSNSIENEVPKEEQEEDDQQETEEEEEEEEEEEALSLCDLPINEENKSRKQDPKTDQAIEPNADFNFGSWVDCAVTEPEMCAADELFFQGQILPLRNSVSSESYLTGLRTTSQNLSRCVSISEPNSGGSTTTNSRSSSIRSHNSSSSCSSLTTKAYKPKTIRNQFHSHPSPSPQIRVSSFRHGNVNHQSQKSTIWSLFRVGLVQTPEMALALQDLKVRSVNSTNSSNSTSSRFSSSNNKKIKSKINDEDNKKKKKQWLFGGCKCSVDSIEAVNIPAKNPIIKTSIGVNESSPAPKEELEVKQKTKEQQGKQAMSRNRTFEWLKQLSLEGTSDHESTDSRRH